MGNRTTELVNLHSDLAEVSAVAKPASRQASAQVVVPEEEQLQVWVQSTVEQVRRKRAAELVVQE
eukprot:2102552-Rhodomonas_salina.3